MRRKFFLLVLVPALLAVPVVPAGARVSDGDLQRAAAALEQARAEAGAAGAALADGRAEAARLRARLERLADEVAGAEVRFAQARREALQRVRSLYVAAGAAAPVGAALGTEGAVRRTYAAAVAERDREVINTLAAAAADRDRLRRSLREQARVQADLAARLEQLAGEAGRELAEAEAEYARVRAAWEAQEAERRAAEAAAAAAARTTTTTTTASTTTPASTTTTAASTTTTAAGGGTSTTTTTAGAGGSTTTTTLPPPVEGGPFPPSVERWRPLVAHYFPANLVEEALSVMRCESYGNPYLVNPVSGASGLFQHMPRYFPARAAAAGFPGASPLEAEPNIAAAAWLVEESLEDGLPAWYFWSCKP